MGQSKSDLLYVQIMGVGGGVSSFLDNVQKTYPFCGFLYSVNEWQKCLKNIPGYKRDLIV